MMPCEKTMRKGQGSMNTDVLMQGLKLGGFFWIIFGLPPFLTAIILKIRDAAAYDRLSGAVTGKKKKHLILYALLSFAASVPG